MQEVYCHYCIYRINARNPGSTELSNINVEYFLGFYDTLRNLTGYNSLGKHPMLKPRSVNMQKLFHGQSDQVMQSLYYCGSEPEICWLKYIVLQKYKLTLKPQSGVLHFFSVSSKIDAAEEAQRVHQGKEPRRGWSAHM